MASSFVQQIPCIVKLLQTIKPTTILDIGKGFGKYGFLMHEYLGIDNTKKIDNTKTLAELSSIKIDAVEADTDLMLPHLPHLYNKVYFDDVTKIYKALPVYDLILMVDIIEHLEKQKAEEMIKHFLSKNITLLIATPIDFFNQDLYESEFEHHLSHFTIKDFKQFGFVNYQVFDGGGVYLLAKNKIDTGNFGNTLYNKLKRIRRAIINEM